MERNYETVVIVKPEVGEADLKGIIKSAGTAIDGGGGRVVRVDEWGRKRLAYPIAKKNEGYYVLFDYSGSPASVKAIERFFKFNEDCLRYQTVTKDSKEAAVAPVEKAPTVSGEDAPEAPVAEAAVAEAVPAPVEEAEATTPVEEAAPAAVEDTPEAAPAEGEATAPVEEAAKTVSEDKGGENG